MRHRLGSKLESAKETSRADDANKLRHQLGTEAEVTEKKKRAEDAKRFRASARNGGAGDASGNDASARSKAGNGKNERKITACESVAGRVSVLTGATATQSVESGSDFNRYSNGLS